MGEEHFLRPFAKDVPHEGGAFIVGKVALVPADPFLKGEGTGGAAQHHGIVVALEDEVVGILHPLVVLDGHVARVRHVDEDFPPSLDPEPAGVGGIVRGGKRGDPHIPERQGLEGYQGEMHSLIGPVPHIDGRLPSLPSTGDQRQRPHVVDVRVGNKDRGDIADRKPLFLQKIDKDPFGAPHVDEEEGLPIIDEKGVPFASGPEGGEGEHHSSGSAIGSFFSRAIARLVSSSGMSKREYALLKR